MLFPSSSSKRGSAILTVGVATALLFGLVTAAIASMREGAGFFLSEVNSVDPWFVAYSALATPEERTTLLARGIQWRVERGAETCSLIRGEGKTSVEVASANLEPCTIAGASVDGRFVTLGPTERTTAWMLYDDRPRLLRPVPRPVIDGEWLTIDPARTTGLYRGRIRSTQSEGVSTWLWLTDGVGSALWAGDVSQLDPDGSVLPLRLLTRSDGAILLSYRVTLPEGEYVQRLAMLTPWRIKDGWQPVNTNMLSTNEPWHLTSWEPRGTTGEAIITTMSSTTKQRISTP